MCVYIYIHTCIYFILFIIPPTQQHTPHAYLGLTRGSSLFKADPQIINLMHSHQQGSYHNSASLIIHLRPLIMLVQYV